MHATAWSLVPFLLVIPVSIITRQVLPGLAAGLIAGAFMVHPSVFGGINGVLDYILREVAVPDNLRLIVFLYGFGAFVGLVRVSGGVGGFAEWALRHIRTERAAFGLTWVSSLATFMAPDFRIITVAPVVKHVFARLHVPLERVAIAIDITATPLCAVIPIGTAFVGYMVGLLATAAHHTPDVRSPYHLLLQSIPMNLFAWVVLAYGLVTTFLFKGHVRAKDRQSEGGVKRTAAGVSTASGNARGRGIAENHRAKPPGLVAESRLRLASQFAQSEFGMESDPRATARSKKDLASGENREATSDTGVDAAPDPVEWVAERSHPNAFNLLIPLGLLLSLTIVLTWWDGHLHSNTFFGALAQANAARAMLQSLLVTLVFSVALYSFQRHPISRSMFGFLAGGNEMMGVIVLLILVWAVSAVSADLGFTAYTESAIGKIVPPALIAPAMFLFGCVISYVIGSSFGTWGMLMPLGFSLAASAHASLPLVAGAVFASGTFGGFASPLSDNTVAMSAVLKLPVMAYARQKLRVALPIAGACTVLYAGAGWILG